MTDHAHRAHLWTLVKDGHALTACLATGAQTVVRFYMDAKMSFHAERESVDDALKLASRFQVDCLRRGWHEFDIDGFCPG